ncbi:hypothetical protein GCM10010404_03090 [Nonomuraea africana]|uniref:Uncharacterized protein n=1 Tax=Nonomuraea africana TaxID=46171 RepID=A0ABR9KBC3_9ACTN|nr:hypothetical protein [Nonomuraea africana]MBE1559310.1 hypothetical protein [Nonomuraea africana]
MRTLVWPLALLLAALPLTSGCAFLDGRRSAAEFEDRAEEVMERWRGSTADRNWRQGFVPLEDFDLAPDRPSPMWAGLSAHNGVWEPDVELPSAPPRPATLRWADGSTLTVPLVSASAAFAELSRPANFIDEECPATGCRALRVVGASLVEVAFRTSRGITQVPAWEFTVKGVKGTFRRVAVDPSAIRPRPTARPEESEEVRAYLLTAPDALLLGYGHGACTRRHGVRAHESADLVVVDAYEESGSGPCPAVLRLAQAAVKLGRPLGDRLVLDSGTGLPVVRLTAGADLRFPHRPPPR